MQTQFAWMVCWMPTWRRVTITPLSIDLMGTALRRVTHTTFPLSLTPPGARTLFVSVARVLRSTADDETCDSPTDS